MAQQLKNRLMYLLTEKERTERRRINRLEIAKAIGVSHNTISSWLLNDVKKIEAHVLIGLCNYFNCKIEDLLYIEDVPEQEDISQADSPLPS